MNFYTLSLCLVGAYCLGSIPFGLLTGFMARRIDIREHGSKNIGATNVFRVVGKKWGIFVFVMDALKGYVACMLPRLVGGHGSWAFVPLVLGIIAILGHTFPVWLKFKGGKGVATSLGVFLAAAWAPTLIAFAVWGLALFLSHIISISSLIAAFVFPFMIALFYRSTPDLRTLLPVSVALAIFIFYTHRANIKRLFQGTEKKLF